ncbi:helix-turn-helix transcriptional regulator [Sphingomonas agri]|uniref:helix-turn-helix transcriptional regulator n=1 Tax=Sphingomonas agri TaxID=1813878 RepID=UPI0031200C41
MSDPEERTSAMAQSSRQAELKKFLRARRASLPVDTPPGRPRQRRRTPGLRREEVADRAGISVTWYTWLEQGRDIHCSIDMLERLAGALQLSETDMDYLFRLAGYAAPMKRSTTEVDARIQVVLDGFLAGPAFLLSPRLDVLAFNRLGDEVFDFGGRPGPFGRNHLWRGFMDPERKALYRDWEAIISGGVAFLRSNYATRIGDPEFEAIISELSVQSHDFARMWGEHRTMPLQSVDVVLEHPRLGHLEFASTRFALPTLNDHLTFFITPRNKVTAAAMTRAGKS